MEIVFYIVGVAMLAGIFMGVKQVSASLVRIEKLLENKKTD